RVDRFVVERAEPCPHHRAMAVLQRLDRWPPGDADARRPVVIAGPDERVGKGAAKRRSLAGNHEGHLRASGVEVQICKMTVEFPRRRKKLVARAELQRDIGTRTPIVARVAGSAPTAKIVADRKSVV